MATKLHWIGVNSTVRMDTYDIAGNWYDLTTHTMSTSPPTIADTIEIGRGLHYLSGGYGVGNSSASTLIALPGANIQFVSPASVPDSVHWNFGTINIKGGAIVAGSVITASQVYMAPGSTFSPQEGGDHTGNPGSAIGALYNNGGDFVGSDMLTLGINSTTHAEFVQNWGGVPGYGMPGPFGFEAGESVIPVADGLHILLGDIVQGTKLDAINIALANITSGHDTLTGGGSGFFTTLLPISMPVAPNTTVQAALVTPDTSSLGYHTDRITMSGSDGVQVLTITDHII